MKGRLRVVAGEAGGLRLVAPPNSRPTTDRVREALFSALGPDPVQDAVVLDLFAGSGALAIEALSRGAQRAVLVDVDRDAEAACEQNILTTRFMDRARVERTTTEQFLRHPPVESPFNLVLCDPPYELPDAEVATVLHSLHAPEWLMGDALVVVERAAPTWEPPEGWTTSWQRGYGDTLVTIVHVSS
ncbi:MAG: 16S rRNA (guanine(966)-N(2))-methyltransferase RsmD [Acidimicrobiia bacterium]